MSAQSRFRFFQRHKWLARLLLIPCIPIFAIIIVLGAIVVPIVAPLPSWWDEFRDCLKESWSSLANLPRDLFELVALWFWGRDYAKERAKEEGDKWLEARRAPLPRRAK